MNEKDLEVYRRIQKDPFYFIQMMRGLVPQINKEDPFIKGKHITRQQARIVKAVMDGVNGGKNKITIRSGHGIGKSSILSVIILRYLFSFKDCQVPCTAPTQSQIYDVLWKELSIWLNRMPEGVREQYERQGDYIRMKDSPEIRFARARTGKKENTEALAGVHADHVLLVADEASGIPDEIFDASKGALTNPHVLFIMISNPTRNEGYFYRSHTKFREQFRCLRFNSEESPIVDQSFVDNIIMENGVDSDQYRIRVQGKFPLDSGMTEDGYIDLINESDCEFVPAGPMRPNLMGVDPAGQGKDLTVIVARDNFFMKILSMQQTSTELSIAELIASNASSRDIPIENMVYDNFGVGANLGLEMSNLGRPIGLNVGVKAHNTALFENLRAELYRRFREWIKKGGKLIGTKEQRKDLFMVKYKRGLNGKIKIMPKDEMRKKYGKSPDKADAAMLTFYKTIIQLSGYQQKKPQRFSALTRASNQKEVERFPDKNPFK